MDLFENKLVDIATVDHPVFKVTDIIMDCSRCMWDAAQCWSMFSISNLNHYLTPQNFTVPEGTIPQVNNVSFRFPPAPIHSEPYTFKLHLTNISDQKGFWAIFTRPPSKSRVNKKIQPKKFASTTEFEDNHDLSLQIWTRKFNYDPGVPYKIPSTFNSLRDLTNFEITPTSGSLKSKESQVITLKYSFSSLGSHEVSFLLRVYPAIFIWLDFKGRTLDVNQPFLTLMDKTHLTLHPISLSDLDPPVQMFWMYNGGNVKASYTVDLEPFEKLKDENYGHAVIKCISPKGSVPPKSWSAIKIRFSPLEYSSYSVLAYSHLLVPLIIYPNYNKTPYQVLLTGSAAMNPAVSLRPAAINETVRQFALFAHGVPVTLSPSHVTISHLIPTGHTVQRMVFLTNLHSRNTMKYYWQNMPIEGGGMISFQPNCGRLAPKEEVSCKIVIKAGDTATVMSAKIECRIEDETAYVLYEFVLNQWRDFITTQRRDSEQPSNEASNKPEKPEAFTRLLAVSFYIGNTFGQFDNITSKEKSRMGFIAPVQSDKDGDSLKDASLLPFTPTGSQLCQSVISDMIWDLIQSGSFKSFCKVATKRKAPLFEEYVIVDDKSSKNGDENGKLSAPQQNEMEDEATVPLQSMSEIMEKSIFNVLHEMAERYAHTSTQQNWFDVPPIQPKALVDVEKYKSLF